MNFRIQSVCALLAGSARAAVAAVQSPMKAITFVLSICNLPPSITPPVITTSVTRPLKDIIRTCSQNRTTFDNFIVPGTINIPCLPNALAPQSACSPYEWSTAADDFARKQLRLPDSTLSRFGHKIYILPKGTGCAFGGLGVLGPNCHPDCRVWISGDIPDKFIVYFHELGHNLGLSHASYLNDQYGDLTDAMGYCCSSRCYSAHNLKKLGWAEAKARLTLPLAKMQEFKLAPGEFVMIVDTTRHENIYIQFRSKKSAKYPFDNGLRMTAVNIYMVPHFPLDALTNLVEMLWEPNKSWTSLYSYRVVLLSIGDQMAKIRIEPSALVPIYLFSDRIPV